MEELQGKEAYKAKKAQKEQEKTAQQRGAAGKRAGGALVKWFFIVVIIAGAVGGFVFLVKQQLPQGEDLSQTVPIQSRGHIPVGSQHEPYNSNPPSSGQHYAQTARVTFYRADESPADENIVHNLEHGDIWVSFHPRISEDAKKVLKGFVAGKVIVSGREANDFDVSLAAWGRVDGFNLEGGEVSKRRIRDFITRYINKGPERTSTPAFHNR